MKMRFYQCEICKKVIVVVTNAEIPTICCGKEMHELIPNKTDGSAEKHVPVFHIEGNSVHVLIGSAPHPMEEQHYISWIGVQTKHGFQFAELKPNVSPEASFFIGSGDCIQAVYAFCNLHGLWCSENAAAKHNA